MKKEKNKNEINYYGTEDNYIHAKFGDLKKAFNFTEEFEKKYPKFSEEYRKYWFGESYAGKSLFTNPLEIVNYIINFDIPVYAYFNFTDTPATWEEVQDYLKDEYLGNKKLYKFDKDENNNYTYFSLDGDKMKECE